jgi:hypothetical protein
MDSICSPGLKTPPPPPSVWLDDFQHAADQTMENTGDTVPSILDFPTAPIKSYQSKLMALLKTYSVDNFLESLTEYDLARITSAGTGYSNVPYNFKLKFTEIRFKITGLIIKFIYPSIRAHL